MAKAPSKIMSIAEKKMAQTNLKIAIKQNADLAKALDADTKAAEKALAAAKKSADAKAKDAAKAAAVIAKAVDAEIKAAQKSYDAAVAAAAKKKAAAAQGAAKLTGQMTALDAAPTGAPVKAPKATVAKAPTESPALV